MWGVGIAMRFESLQAGPVMQMPVFILLFLAPVYVPLDLLTGWIDAVAHVNPMTALVEGGRDFISGQDFDVWLMFAIAMGLGAAFLAWAVRGVHRAGDGRRLNLARPFTARCRSSPGAGTGKTRAGRAVFTGTSHRRAAALPTHHASPSAATRVPRSGTRPTSTPRCARRSGARPHGGARHGDGRPPAARALAKRERRAPPRAGGSRPR